MQHIETMTLVVVGNTWYSRTNNPAIKELFGTDMIPTAFTTAMYEEEVAVALKSIPANIDTMIIGTDGFSWF